jgi:nucleoside-diphosphate-sugar epimerase
MNAVERNAQTILAQIDPAPLEGRAVLITGGSGLLGTQIVATLQAAIEYGLHIDLYVQVQRGLNAIEPGERTKLIYANLANPYDCERLPDADVVISAASYAQPLRFIAEPLQALRSASTGLLALLERCRVGGSFLYISSSEVYCDCHARPPFSEDDIGTITPYHPRACYITGKMFGEAMTYLYRNRGLSTVAVRPGIIYGPGFKKGDRRSWVQFAERAVTQGKIELMDAGLVRRTFLYMTDGIELILKALLYGTQPVYNVAGHDSLSIARLAETIGEIAGVPVVIPEEDHGVAGTPEDLQLNGSRIENEFNKRHYVSLEEGLAHTVEWARELYA